MITVDGKKLEVTQFPNGESKIIFDNFLRECGCHVDIMMKYEDDRDLIHLMYLKRHIDEFYDIRCNLIIPYMPYSRMDRVEQGSDFIFTLKYISSFINSLNFYTVQIGEPHSDVCIALLNNVTRIDNISARLAESQLRYHNRLLKGLNKSVYLVYPDAGASKRYYKQIKYDKILTCSKERDFNTGHIKKLSIEGELPSEPFKAIIVDDLCSKGGTFMLTAEKLREIGATEIILVVAHCEKSILEGSIPNSDLIDRVITTDSIISKADVKGINKIEVNNYMEV